MYFKKIYGLCTILIIILFLSIIWIQEIKIRIALTIIFIFIAILRDIIRRKLGIPIFTFNDDNK